MLFVADYIFMPIHLELKKAIGRKSVMELIILIISFCHAIKEGLLSYIYEELH